MAPSEPLGLEPDEFRKLGYQAVDMMADYFAGIDETSVFPGKPQAEIEAEFEDPLPEEGEDPSKVLQEWSTRVLPNATHLGSPRYFGYVNGSGTMMGVLAEALAATTNMNVGAWKASPAATEIERRTIQWIAQMIGYPTGAGGMLTSGGTMANLTGILTGLRTLTDYDAKKHGLQSPQRRGKYTLYMADHEAHSSLSRVAEVLGLGANAVRLVPSHDDFTLDVDALEERLDEDAAQGDVPFCVVAHAGSFNVGAVDPLSEIARVCQERDLWFHADGAIGAFGAILPDKKPQFDGLEHADSVTLDPHKWLFVNYECGCILVNDATLLHESFAMHAAYLQGTKRTPYEGVDYLELGPQMSRADRALKVWMSLKHRGLAGYRELLSQSVQCCQHLDARVREAEDFVALHEPNLNMYSFQYAPPDLQDVREDPDEQEATDAYLDTLNQRIADEIQLTGIAFLMTTSVHDRTVLRLSICSHRTTPRAIDRTFETIREIGEEEDKTLREEEDPG